MVFTPLLGGMPRFDWYIIAHAGKSESRLCWLPMNGRFIRINGSILGISGKLVII